MRAPFIAGLLAASALVSAPAAAQEPTEWATTQFWTCLDRLFAAEPKGYDRDLTLMAFRYAGYTQPTSVETMFGRPGYGYAGLYVTDESYDYNFNTTRYQYSCQVYVPGANMALIEPMLRDIVSSFGNILTERNDPGSLSFFTERTVGEYTTFNVRALVDANSRFPGHTEISVNQYGE